MADAHALLLLALLWTNNLGITPLAVFQKIVLSLMSCIGYHDVTIKLAIIKISRKPYDHQPSVNMRLGHGMDVQATGGAR